MTLSAGVLLLADSRLPAGGHVHSGGVEALVDRGLVRDPSDLATFLRARIRTSGLGAAAVAALAAALADQVRGCPDGDRWQRWDAAVDVRTPSPALREASRAQGAALLRTATRSWPAAAALAELAALPGRPHHPLVLGAAAAAAGAGPGQAAALAVHHLVGGAASAAVRLLGLDPLAVAAVQAGLAPLADTVVAEATTLGLAAAAGDDPDLLPADATPAPDILAELHHATEVSLFAS